jgi:hypothetical protein
MKERGTTMLHPIITAEVTRLRHRERLLQAEQRHSLFRRPFGPATTKPAADIIRLPRPAAQPSGHARPPAA